MLMFQKIQLNQVVDRIVIVVMPYQIALAQAVMLNLQQRNMKKNLVQVVVRENKH
jgi:hypothetical protein